jgi:hypothetical protein
VATLAFGIAATSVAFALVNSLFLRPPPIAEPVRLVRIYSAYAGGLQYFTLSYPDYADIRGLDAVFEGVVAEQPVPFGVGVRGWHSERFYEQMFEKTPEIVRFAQEAKSSDLDLSPSGTMLELERMWTFMSILNIRVRRDSF